MNANFKSFSRVKSTQDEKMRFIKGKELKVTQIELLLFFIFKRITKELFCSIISGYFVRDSYYINRYKEEYFSVLFS